MNRGRITVPDVLIYLVTVAFVAGLYPAYTDLLEANIDVVPEGPAIIFRTLLPLMLLVLLGSIYLKAGAGPK